VTTTSLPWADAPAPCPTCETTVWCWAVETADAVWWECSACEAVGIWWRRRNRACG
jgi:hypothetical protein